ncbi:hypothetical protein [Streptococcus sp. S784/96/1]|uniref:hypothetical protein n=1 Tax=Streptococcus sp. S784/96/1 TaxID=2653499 RepID=UPI001386A1BE|nr:hypothetical protein [Streptococcus sp. S784/96/1]
MKKKILGILTLVASLFLLIGCSSESLDGTYYRFDEYDKGKSVYLYKKDTIEIEDKKLTSSENGVAKVDIEEGIINLSGKEIPFFYEEGVLSINDVTYVKVGSDKEKKLEKMVKE